MENSMEVSQKLKIRTTIWADSPTVKFVTKGNEIGFSNSYLQSHAHLRIIHNSQYMKTINV